MTMFECRLRIRELDKNRKLEISAKKITVDRRAVLQCVSYMSKFCGCQRRKQPNEFGEYCSLLSQSDCNVTSSRSISPKVHPNLLHLFLFIHSIHFLSFLLNHKNKHSVQLKSCQALTEVLCSFFIQLISAVRVFEVGANAYMNFSRESTASEEYFMIRFHALTLTLHTWLCGEM